MQSVLKYIHEHLQTRKKAGLIRELTPYFVKNNSNLYLNLNDYLQLSKHPRIIQAGQKALET